MDKRRFALNVNPDGIEHGPFCGCPRPARCSIFDR
jgi:hypothetical protein